jgi:hypothetical protein
MAYCQRCISIPFLKLPAEDEDGWPHHESLELLMESARSCPLCNPILGAGKLDEASRKKRGDNPYSDPLQPYFLELAAASDEIPELTMAQEVDNKTKLIWKTYVYGESYDPGWSSMIR